MRIPINSIINFVLLQCKKMNIDESHSLNHALDVLNISKDIYNEEVNENPFIKNHEHIIYTSALMHDTCDSKYCNEIEAKDDISVFLEKNNYKKEDSDAIISIISSMSYHKVKQNGFPNLNKYQHAFHIVREADLLSGYNFNRAILYGIHVQNLTFTNSFEESKELYDNRMNKLIENNLFVTNYGKKNALLKNQEGLRNIKNIDNIINN